jgi:DNA gyrase subunit B
MKKQDYGNESISSLKGADRVRKRPGVIFGSDGLEGCQHAVFEILSNAIDESREGYGKLITLTRHGDHSIEIEDFGRGCPVDWNQAEERFNWELVYCELYAGGKYHNNEDAFYEYSLGLNGLGACATQYAAEYMDVVVRRDGHRYDLRFERGEIVGDMKKQAADRKQTGTHYRWRPDLDVFTEINIPDAYFHDLMVRQAVVNPGVTFRFRSQREDGKYDQADYLYPNGIMDYIAELAGDSALTAPVFRQAERKGRDRGDKPEYKVKLSVAFCFTGALPRVEHYHNSSFLEHGGSPDKATRSAFVAALDGWLKGSGKYNKAESKITWPDVADCLLLISSNFSTLTSYENQTKKAINNKFIQEAMADFLRAQLEVYYLENRAEADRAAEQVLINKRSRETAERTRLGLKKKLSGGLDVTNRVSKYVDCRSRDVNRRELYIVEGDSALGACKLGRDAEFQAIIPVRGKILNCLKAETDKIFRNEIILDILRVLGCGVELRGKMEKEVGSFDLSGLRWSKIILCTDADYDGFHIRTMLLTMLYRLTPTLIERELVYIAESPLYEITSKNQSFFAYSDKERDERVAALGSAKVTISRSKGLGENEPDMMWQTTMNPETRRLIQVVPAEAEATAAMFDLLQGDNLAGRKAHIAEFGSLYVDRADVS